MKNASSDFSADDLFQETLIDAFQHVRGLDARGGVAFFAWLKTIARNRHLNRLKAMKSLKRGGDRRRIVARAGAAAIADSTATSILQLIATTDPTPSAVVRNKEAVHVVAAALSQLDPQRRQVIELRYGQGMTNAQVAAAIGKSEGAVKMLTSRILQEMRESIDAQFKDFASGA
jgi:RNA polymerase sigma factor (sigma-70 family)